LCEGRFIINPAPVPAAELMPPIPPTPEISGKTRKYYDISVELVDFGMTRQVRVSPGSSVGKVIEEAGEQFRVNDWATTLIRSGGADYQSDALVSDLRNPNQLVVYLKCVWKRFRPELIAPLSSCEELTEDRYEIRVEIPAYDVSYTVSAMSSETVLAAVMRAPVKLNEIEQVTYGGNVIEQSLTMKEMAFRNNTALVLYPKEPCPSQSVSPSTTPSSHPSASPSPSMTLPTPSSSPQYHLVEKPLPGSLQSQEEERSPMTSSAKIFVTFQGRTFPVLIKPIARGVDIFDAVESVSGKNRNFLTTSFIDRPIDHDTLLKPFGFVDGDSVIVMETESTSK